MRPRFELAQIIDRFKQEFEQKHTPNTYLLRTLSALQRCRTAALGGHADKCDTCGHVRISYNSCRNRHCPKCQNTQREAWIEDRKQDLIPAPYFHVVFTVPDNLNSLFMHHPVALNNILFRTARETIAQFSFTKMNAETGMVAVLHTWGQNLSLHPHLHCVVPGGGIDHRNRWKPVPISSTGKAFQFRVEHLSRVFRGKFITAVQEQLPQEKTFINALYKTNWVVYAKEPFAGPEQVLEYLGRYTHKVAISNHRLLNISDEGVTFRWRDYRDNQKKVMTLEGSEFLRRFCQHILPRGFVRLRHYGLLSSTKRPLLRSLQRCLGIAVCDTPKQKQDWKVICREKLNYDPDTCPCCGKGRMIPFERILPGRAPPLPEPATKQAINDFMHPN